MERDIQFVLNGLSRTLRVKPSDKLIDVLRDKLAVNSVKYGCGKGECGACTIILNGKTVRSCIMYAVEADGCEIETLEGFQRLGKTAIQEIFARHNSFQCGYCAPGFILSTEELLRNNPDPTEEDIKEALAGNLCRCTGYKNILEALSEMVELSKAGNIL